MQLRLSFVLAFAVLLSGMTGLSHAKERAPDPLSPARKRDQAAIEWKLPHQFDEAVREAKAKNRILLIKGVSFGIDEAGATCATDGMW